MGSSWIFWSLLSALFAGATAVLAKIGVAGVNSHLATAIRTTVVLVFAWALALATSKATDLSALSRRTWLFLALSGVAIAADLRAMDLDLELQVRHRNRHRNDIKAFAIHAPITGLVVMQTVRRAGEMAQVALGDQVAPAQPFMKIVDTNSMQVEAAVSQVESEEMRLGQPAQVVVARAPSSVSKVQGQHGDAPTR